MCDVQAVAGNQAPVVRASLTIDYRPLADALASRMATDCPGPASAALSWLRVSRVYLPHLTDQAAARGETPDGVPVMLAAESEYRE